MGQREDLIQIFITESRENIELLEQEVVRLETEPENRAPLDEILRAFHTLKGKSGIVGMTRFEKIAHITEEVLTEIRDGKRNINSEVISFLLDSLDQLIILHQSIEETGSDQIEVATVLPPKKAVKSKRKKAASKKSGKAAQKKSDEEVAGDGSWGIFSDNLEADKKSATAAKDEEPVKDPDNVDKKARSKTSGASKADPSSASKSAKQVRTKRIKLTGELTIQRAAELKETISKSFPKSGKVVLDLQNITSIDLSFLQLLYATQQAVASTGKTFTLSCQSPEVLNRVIEQCGFSGQLGSLIPRKGEAGSEVEDETHNSVAEREIIAEDGSWGLFTENIESLSS